jgi:hypothetical protein
MNATTSEPAFTLLLHGIETLECAYYLRQVPAAAFDFGLLRQKREELQQAGDRDGAAVTLGGVPFLLHSHGTKSRYPFYLTGEDFHIQCGEFNKPSFFVKFLSQALWRESAHLLHEKFLAWAKSVGLVDYQPERISRVDFAFDYALPIVDFDLSHFVSRCNKDSLHRENGKVQTFTIGKGDLLLRVYDKVAEIEQQSNKTWFFVLWDGQDQDVWRIEWQIRKAVLRQFSICTFADLQKIGGDLLRYLCAEHTSLRVPNGDENRSRWPVHPLWADLQGRIREMAQMGVCRFDGKNTALAERQAFYAKTVYGYLKAVAATYCVQHRRTLILQEEALGFLRGNMERLYDSLAWQMDVQKRIAEIERGAW